MPHRDFDAVRALRLRDREPVTFTIGGERFTCVVEPSLGDALALADAPEPDQSEVGAARAIVRFVESLLVPEDRKRWRRTVARQSPRRWRRREPVSAAEIVELGAWLAASYTTRPTRPSSVSSSGRQHSGDTSTVKSGTSAAGDSSTSS